MTCLLSAVQLYEQWFEEKCLSMTGDFYRQEARKLLDECNCSEYMERVCISMLCCHGDCVVMERVCISMLCCHGDCVVMERVCISMLCRHGEGLYLYVVLSWRGTVSLCCVVM